MLNVHVYPLPVSLSSLLSYLFPAHVQAYYDGWLESSNAGRRRIMAAMRVLPSVAMPSVVAAADLFFAVGLAAFALRCSIFTFSMCAFVMAAVMAAKV